MGRGNAAQLDPQIQEHRQTWIARLSEPALNLEAKTATALWDESLLPGWDRELPIPLLLLVSNEADTSEKRKAAFLKSMLWRRRAVPGLLAPMARADYRDWARTVPVFDRGNLDSAAEKRQFVSGVPVYSAIVQQAFAGMGLSPAHSCHIRDYSLDPGPSTAAFVLQLVTQQLVVSSLLP